MNNSQIQITLCSLLWIPELRMNKEMCNRDTPRGTKPVQHWGGLSTWPKVQFYAAKRRGKMRATELYTSITTTKFLWQREYIWCTFDQSEAIRRSDKTQNLVTFLEIFLWKTTFQIEGVHHGRSAKQKRPKTNFKNRKRKFRLQGGRKSFAVTTISVSLLILLVVLIVFNEGVVLIGSLHGESDMADGASNYCPIWISCHLSVAGWQRWHVNDKDTCESFQLFCDSLFAIVCLW